MIYLDHHSTTPVDAEVLAAMMPFFSESFANPASQHHFGWLVEQHVEKARKQILQNLNAAPNATLIFTSGTTESNHLAILGLKNHPTKKPHFITQAIEHQCVLGIFDFLKFQGHAVTVLPVQADGTVCPHALKKSLTKDTVLVSIMHANNEIGSINPIKDLAAIVHQNSAAIFHCDAAQSVGKLAVDVTDLDVDLMSFSAHKMHGPKGIGALYVKNDVVKNNLRPLFLGTDHEMGLRAGSLNVPAIIGFAKALEISCRDLTATTAKIIGLKKLFLDIILRHTTGVSIHHPHQSLPGLINIGFDFVKSEELILSLPHMAFSSGSACASRSTEPSYVIQALGKSSEVAAQAVRVSLGKNNTPEEIEKAAHDLLNSVEMLRSKSLLYQMSLQK